MTYRFQKRALDCWLKLRELRRAAPLLEIPRSAGTGRLCHEHGGVQMTIQEDVGMYISRFDQLSVPVSDMDRYIVAVRGGFIVPEQSATNAHFLWSIDEK